MLRHILMLSVVAAAALGLNSIGAFWPIERELSDFRAKHHSIQATGDVVFVAIDKRSLDANPVWPWPRSEYANALTKLNGLGVTDILIDVDLSAHSTQKEDMALAQALEMSDAVVLLPSFVQTNTNQKGSGLGLNRPAPMFRDVAWDALVNVIPDADGVARQYHFGLVVDGEPLESAATLLAAASGSSGTTFSVNMSIDPASVPYVSFSDLLAGNFPADIFQDKQVVIGAEAVELRDTYVVPVHGQISGPMFQVLAAESLIQGKELAWLDASPAVAIAAFLALLILSSRSKLTFALRICAFIAIGATTEVIGFWLYIEKSTLLPSGAAQVFIFSTMAIHVFSENATRRWLLSQTRRDQRNLGRIVERIVTDSTNAIVVLRSDGTLLKTSRAADTLWPDLATTEDVLREPTLGESITGALRECIETAETSSPDTIGSNNWLAVRLPGRRERWVEFIVKSAWHEDVSGKNKQYLVVTLTAREITKERQQTDRIRYLSDHDELTDSLRRRAFLEAAGELAAPRIFVAINLHRFKQLNSVLGREAADEVLRMAAERLHACAPNSIVGHLGGDSFALATEISDPATDVHALVKKISQVMNERFQTSAHEAAVNARPTGRVGVRLGHKVNLVDEPAGKALVHAEMALDEARRTNGSTTVAFQPAFLERQLSNSRLEADLWRALDQNQIKVLYQPQVDMRTRKLLGVEALVRWDHAELGRVSPAVFVEIAEANGYIEELGRWVLQTACHDAMNWPDDITVAVNVAPLQFLRSDLRRDVELALGFSGLPAERLHIELTESGFLDTSDELLEKMQAVRDLGVKIALDDFGTGYSSFGYLASFPIDKIKIDQSFVRSMLEDSRNMAVVKSVITLANGLGTRLIAEGIETEDHANRLLELGCIEAQGYLYGRPQEASDILAYQQFTAALRA
ncbi:MAG: EAL domain-containing protein [Pseudomonadota bacterium]